MLCRPHLYFLLITQKPSVTDNLIVTDTKGQSSVTIVWVSHSLFQSRKFGPSERWDTWQWQNDGFVGYPWGGFLTQATSLATWLHLAMWRLPQERLSGCSAEASGAFWDFLAFRSVSRIDYFLHKWPTLGEHVVATESTQWLQAQWTVPIMLMHWFLLLVPRLL